MSNFRSLSHVAGDMSLNSKGQRKIRLSLKQGTGNRGTGNGERGMGNGERGMGNGESNGERGMGEWGNRAISLI